MIFCARERGASERRGSRQTILLARRAPTKNGGRSMRAVKDSLATPLGEKV